MPFWITHLATIQRLQKIVDATATEQNFHLAQITQ